jgi:hypothetical protein
VPFTLNPNQSNVDNLNNVRRDASRHFRNKKKEYLKAGAVRVFLGLYGTAALLYVV